MDFIGPMKMTSRGSLYIFHVIDYFSRFSVAYACKTANAPDVVESLKDVFAKYATPRAIYCDRGQHFDNDEVRGFLGGEGIIITYSPSGSSKSTGMIEVENRLLEDIVRRSSEDWDLALPKSVRSLNSRIVTHLGFSPSEVLIGAAPSPMSSAIDPKVLSANSNVVETWFGQLNNPTQHAMAIRL